MKEILSCFDMDRVEFTNNSNPEDVYKEKHYAFEGELMDLCDATRKLDEISDGRRQYALMYTGARPWLIRTNRKI